MHAAVQYSWSRLSVAVLQTCHMIVELYIEATSKCPCSFGHQPDTSQATLIHTYLETEQPCKHAGTRKVPGQQAPSPVQQQTCAATWQFEAGTLFFTTAIAFQGSESAVVSASRLNY